MWCICENKKTCIGCLIEKEVKEKFGENGLKYLTEHLHERYRAPHDVDEFYKD